MVCVQIENSLYDIKMNVEEYCKVLCTRQYTASDFKEFKSKANLEWHLIEPQRKRSDLPSRPLSTSPTHTCLCACQIAEDYRVNWIVDNLPAATRVVEPPSAGV